LPEWKRRNGLRASLVAVAVGAASLSAFAAEPARVAVVSGAHEAYRAASAALVARLKSAGHACELIELAADSDAALAEAAQRIGRFSPQVIATAGTGTTSAILARVPDVPVVFYMVPNALDAPFMADGAPEKRRVAGVPSDVDPAAQIDWALKTGRRAKTVAVLHSARTRRTAAALERAGRARGVSVVLESASRSEFPKAVETLDRLGCDGVLMISDSEVYDSPSVQRLLLWGLRARKYVWAFSVNIVKAGALSGLYCDGESVGQEAALVVQEVLDGKSPAAIGLRYPRRLGHAVNVHTARMIDEQLDEAALGADVERLGEEP